MSTMLTDLTEPTIETDKQTIDEKQYFIVNEKYQLLLHYQMLILKATEVSPSVRKLVNELITHENLDVIKTKLITTFTE